MLLLLLFGVRSGYYATTLALVICCSAVVDIGVHWYGGNILIDSCHPALLLGLLCAGTIQAVAILPLLLLVSVVRCDNVGRCHSATTAVAVFSAVYDDVGSCHSAAVAAAAAVSGTM